MEEVLTRSATEMARAIRSGQITSVELVQAHLDRIDTVNPALNVGCPRRGAAGLRARDLDPGGILEVDKEVGLGDAAGSHCAVQV